LVGGVEFIRENNVRRLRSAPNAPTTLFNPNPYDVYPGTIIFTPFVGDVTANTQSAYVFDTIKIHPKFEIIGGLRFDRFDASGVSATATALTPIARVDQMVSYRLGAVYKPVPIGSFYVSYGTALNPSLEGLSYSVASAAVDPEKTYTLEAGTKWDLFKNRLLLSGAVFRVNKTNARTPGLPGEEPIVLSGKQRVDGIELSATGNVTRNWSILASYTLLDSEIVSSNTAPTIVNGVSFSEIGKRLINTPKNSVNFWTTYQLPFRLTLGGGARFVDRRYGNAINTRFVDSYWSFDATASYQLNKYVDFRLNGYNLTDKFYFDRITGGQVVPGAARSVLFTTNFHF
jgi:catecholate siderophore receptor